MNSTNNNSFYVIMDDVSPSDLRQYLEENISQTDITFSVEKTEKGNRGLPPEVTACFTPTALIIVGILSQVGAFLIKRYELDRKSQGEIILKFKQEKFLIYLDTKGFPDNLPEHLKDVPVSELEFISISEK